MKKKLSQKYLKECLTYNPDTGIFTWKARPDIHFKTKKGWTMFNSRFSNVDAGHIDNTGYSHVKIDYKSYQSHRLAFLYIEGYFPENIVDHIDKNPLNNKWDNLREASHQCNQQNCKLAKNNTSGITGVVWYERRGRWSAKIKISNKVIHLGDFVNFEDAVMARYHEEITNPRWSCSVESTAYKYLRDNNLLDAFKSKDFTVNNLMSNNTSGVEGVYWDKSRNKWVAQIRASRKAINLGRYDKFEDAVMARYQAELTTRGWPCSGESTAYVYLRDSDLLGF